MAKQYGLIIPGMQKKPTLRTAPARETIKPSIFSEDSSSGSDDGPPQLKLKKSTPIAQPSAMERRMASKMQEKALAEDATVFQYDEVYDEIENKRDMELKTKKNEPKKAKYIERLLVCAERRKLENELRIERQVQKEREEEGEEFKDKEKFVTSSYRKKLEEMRKLVEREKHEDYLEAIGEVTKQNDLDGFYRHLYEQKLGTSKTIIKPANINEDTEENENDIKYKPIPSGKTQKQRSYRKRESSEHAEEQEQLDNLPVIDKKVHLENNMDADSDFSIDSSSSDEEDDVKNTVTKTADVKEIPANEASNSEQKEECKIALNLPSLKTNAPIKENQEKNQETTEDVASETTIKVPLPVKQPKKDIWKKRTVGEAFDAALQRYYERKAGRSG